ITSRSSRAQLTNVGHCVSQLRKGRLADGHFHQGTAVATSRGGVTLNQKSFGGIMVRLLTAALFSAAVCGAPVAAQNNEISFSVGGGSLIGSDESRSARVSTLAYTRYLTERWAVEGSLEFFSVNIPNFGRDGFAGVQGSVLYHLRPAATDRRSVPLPP